MRVEEILSSLSQLSKVELSKVITRAQFLIKLNGRRVQETNSSVTTALLVYAKKYIPHVPDKDLLDLLNPEKEGARLDFISKEVEDMISKLSLERREALKLCGLVVEAGVSRIKQNNKPLSFRTLLYNISDPKSLMLESYPDYFGTPLFLKAVLNANKVK